MVLRKTRQKKGGNMFVDIGVPVVLAGVLGFMKSRNKKYTKKNRTKKNKKKRVSKKK